LDPAQPHDIEAEIGHITGGDSDSQIHQETRQAIQIAASIGATAITLRGEGLEQTFARTSTCVSCGTWFGNLEPVHFHTPCPHCDGSGCKRCARTGLHPQAASVTWNGLRFPELLAQPISKVYQLFADSERSSRVGLPSTARRLKVEIVRRLEALDWVGLGYISLDRPAPTLSRGEAQRVRLAVALTSRLEDMLHVLDEPTIGQHPADVARLLPAFRQLAGPVVFVEHDRIAAASADRAIDLGPGAGSQGGKLIFDGTPAELWQTDTPTGRYFSLRKRVLTPEPRPEPEKFLTVRGACLRNLRGIDIPIPMSHLTVITGVSGSGKSTFVEGVLYTSLVEGKPTGCRGIDGPPLKPVLVDQEPIGRNPRSNPATYTNLADIIRDCFAADTGLSPSHFSFNRPEGACPDCQGMGAVEVRMRYLPSTWIPCPACDGQRFSDEVLAARVLFGDRQLSIADFFELQVSDVIPLLLEEGRLPKSNRQAARRILEALRDVGLGYLSLGQPSPTLSGGEAQRVKLAKFLGKNTLEKHLLILDEPSTGLHPQDINGLLIVLDRLVRAGATILVVEHNTDIIRAADWVIDLGPGAGPHGGELLYAGPPAGLLSLDSSLTGKALREEALSQPRAVSAALDQSRSVIISIREARANNLQGVDVDFHKGALTVVTGVSGSGKSSLVGDVLEAEARRRFLESLSMYERQSTREGPEAPVGSVSGLGVAITVSPERRLYGRRATVGTATEISHHLAVLLSTLGERKCLECGTAMIRNDEWHCPNCHSTAHVAKPRHFNPTNYSAACKTCHGVGTMQVPKPEKLIIHPEKPLIAGAMYSPGFFPKGYLGKPFNHGYDMLQALAARYGFDPAATPWDQMRREAQHAFLFGDPQPLMITFHSRTGRVFTHEGTWPGFYGFIRDWDVGGTYTQTENCPECGGSGLRPEYTAVTLRGYGIYELSQMPLAGLARVLQSLISNLHYPATSPTVGDEENPRLLTYSPDLGEEKKLYETSLHTILKRLHFLEQVGLGYLHLNRQSSSLSAGEAQRIRLAGLLGSGLTSLTVLLDEPSRGLHQIGRAHV
jgi:excinuclease ABC subunit A